MVVVLVAVAGSEEAFAQAASAECVPRASLHWGRVHRIGSLSMIDQSTDR